MGRRHRLSHDVHMRKDGRHSASARSRELVRTLRSVVPAITLTAGLIVLVGGVSSAFGWALIVIGAALAAGQASGNDGSSPSDRTAFPR